MAHRVDFNLSGSREYRVLRMLNHQLVNAFLASLQSPMAAQEKRLKLILTNLEGSTFGRDHGLNFSLTWDEFRSRVPIRQPDEFAPYFARIAAGEKRVLTKENPLSLMETSGTTGQPKRLPVTASWATSVSNAQKLWALSMIKDHPAIAKGKALTVVSPARHSTSVGGLPIGSNTGRMHAKQPWWIKRRYALPDAVAQIESPTARQYVGLRIALQSSITSWTTANPSMILLYCRRMKEWSKALSRDLEAGTLRHGPAELLDYQVRAVLEKGLIKTPPPLTFEPAKLWPLSVVNCWKGGSASYFVSQLPSALGGSIPVREVGITASEGYFALPLGDHWDGGVLWSMGHVLEFKDKSGAMHWSWELKEGEEYRLVISTEAGLCRYDLGDTVQVTGFCHNSPVLRFMGKSDRFLNAVGEKVSERQIAMAIKALQQKHKTKVVGFTVRIQWQSIPCFELAVEGDVDDHFPVLFDTELQRINIEYESKRKSERLGAPVLRRLEPGAYQCYRANRLAQGAPAGQLKDPIVALTETEWSWIERL